MKSPQPWYAVYMPPVKGLPYLAVILATDGTVTARPFDTPDQAAEFNRQLAEAGCPGKVNN